MISLTLKCIIQIKHVDELFLSNLDPIPTKDISSTVAVATSIVEHP